MLCSGLLMIPTFLAWNENWLPTPCRLLRGTNQGVAGQPAGNKPASLLSGTVYVSRALLDLLNKQTSDSNLSVYTDADLQCKWSRSADAAGRTPPFSSTNKAKALSSRRLLPSSTCASLHRWKAYLCWPSVRFKGRGTTARRSGDPPSGHGQLCKQWCRFGGT